MREGSPGGLNMDPPRISESSEAFRYVYVMFECFFLTFFPRAVGGGFPLCCTFGRAMRAAGGKQVDGAF